VTTADRPGARIGVGDWRRRACGVHLAGVDREKRTRCPPARGLISATGDDAALDTPCAQSGRRSPRRRAHVHSPPTDAQRHQPAITLLRRQGRSSSPPARARIFAGGSEQQREWGLAEGAALVDQDGEVADPAPGGRPPRALLASLSAYVGAQRVGPRRRPPRWRAPRPPAGRARGAHHHRAPSRASPAASAWACARLAPVSQARLPRWAGIHRLSRQVSGSWGLLRDSEA